MSAKNSTRWAIVALVCGSTCGACAGPKVDEQIVGPMVPEAKYMVSPQGGHLAIVGRKGSRMLVTVDGVAGPKVDEVITPATGWVDPRPAQALSAAGQQPAMPQPVTFSKDGSHYAYVARLGQEWLLIEDGKEVLRLPAAGAVGSTVGIGGMAGNTDLRLQFGSDDSKHLFFAKSGFAGYELWVDGQKMPGFYASAGTGAQATDPLIFAGGEHFAYLAAMGTHPGDAQTLIVDGKDAGYLAGDLQGTADGHLVGIARSKDGEHLLLDGKLLFKAHQIIAVHVAPAGHRILVVLRHTYPNGNLGQFLLVDGKPAEATLSEQIKRVVFSPDGKRYAAICGRAGAEYVVVDGKKGQEYQFIDSALQGLSVGLSFSPDSSRSAYVANASGKKFIVIDDDESDAYDGLALFRFAPEGRDVLSYGPQGASMRLSIAGNVFSLPRNSGVQMDSFSWSPDRSHYAFNVGANPNGGAAVYLDGKDTGLAGRFTFSPDSKHLAVVGFRTADNKSGLFVDGTLIFPVLQSIGYCAFSPDSQHLFWMSLEPVTTPNPADAFEWITYADGTPVAHHDRGAAAQALLFPQGFSRYASTPPGWSVRPDGALHILTPSPDGIKHLTVMPGADTSITTLLQSAPRGSDKKSASAR